MEVLNQTRPAERAWHFAGFAKRVGAYLIDWILIGLAGWALGLLIGINIFKESWGMIWFGNILNMVYFILMEAGPRQATLGKQIAGIKVITSDGVRMSYGQSIVRSFSKIISAMILLIGFIMVAFTEKKQGLHDIIAGTYVVEDEG